jgi:hypothetical protein
VKMDRELAETIKYWRCNLGMTWRAVARAASENYPEHNFCNGNQIEGMELCKAAALFLGDKPNDKPWN